jgi:MoxR-like ATPase
MTRFKKARDVDTDEVKPLNLQVDTEPITKAESIAHKIDTDTSMTQSSSNVDIIYAPVDYENAFKPYRIGNFVDVMGLKHELYNHVMYSTQPVLLIGDKGAGKTMTVYDLACDLHDDGILGGLISIQGNFNTSDKHMITYNRLKGLSGETVKGFAVNGICLANHFSEGIHSDNPKLVIMYCDELPNMPTETSIILAPLLDGRRMIQTQDGVTWRLNDNARLVFIASGNPSHYAGVNTLQEALMSRFTGYYIGYPSDDSICKMIDFDKYGVPEDVVNPLLTLCSDIHSMKQKQDVDYVISPRDLAYFAEEYQNRLTKYTPKETADQALAGALEKTILINYQDLTERQLVKTSIEETFGLTMTTKYS